MTLWETAWLRREGTLMLDKGPLVRFYGPPSPFKVPSALEGRTR